MNTDMLYNKPSPSELYHEGIRGMHWGQRNGPPYPLGKGQISSSEKKAGSKVSKSAKERDEDSSKKKGKPVEKTGEKHGSSEDSKSPEKSVKRIYGTKAISEMSNEDLNRSIDRLQKEQRYRDLMYDIYGPQGQDYVKRKMSDNATKIANESMVKLGKDVVTALGKKAINNFTKEYFDQELLKN